MGSEMCIRDRHVGAVEAPADVHRPDLAVARRVRTTVDVRVVVDGDPVLVIEEQARRQRVDAVVVDGDRLTPRLAGLLDVDGHVEAAERRRAAGRVEDVRVRVALVVEVDRDVGRRAVGALVARIALAGLLAVAGQLALVLPCLLYTSDAADE